MDEIFRRQRNETVKPLFFRKPQLSHRTRMNRIRDARAMGVSVLSVSVDLYLCHNANSAENATIREFDLSSHEKEVSGQIFNQVSIRVHPC